jgi:hypothetical protein
MKALGLHWLALKFMLNNSFHIILDNATVNYLRGLVTYNEPPAVKTNFTTIVLGLNIVRFEVFTTVTMKNGVFCDVMPCGSCKNLSFGGTQRLRHQGDKNRSTRNNVSRK